LITFARPIKNTPRRAFYNKSKMTTIEIPQPNGRLKSIIRAVPITRLVLFQYRQQKGMTEEWKTWAWEMLDKGFKSDALTQLAGEDLNLNAFEFSSLVDSILKDLELDFTDDDVYFQYVLYVAHQVLNRELSSEEGFKTLCQAAIDTNYHPAFMDFYYLEDNAELLRHHHPAVIETGMRPDNISEWTFSYFEKLIKE
jgi:hypothetical protein